MTHEYTAQASPKRYMLPDEVTGHEVWCSMLMDNVIRGILPLSMQYVDGKRRFYYDIGERVSLQEYGQQHDLSGMWVEKILQNVVETVEYAREFLLDMNKFSFHPEKVYLDTGTHSVWLMYCGCSGPEVDKNMELQELARFFINTVTPQDKKSVDFVYGFYEKIRENTDYTTIKKYVEENKQEPVTEAKRKRQKAEKTIRLDKADDFNWYLAWQQDVRSGLARFLYGSKSLVIIELKKFPCVIGRDDSSDYQLRNGAVSRNHLRLEKMDNNLYITDLQSHNGTWLNGKKLQAGVRTRIKAGDRIMLAGEIFRVQKCEI